MSIRNVALTYMIYTPEAGETQLDLTFATEMTSFHDLRQYKVQMTLKYK